MTELTEEARALQFERVSAAEIRVRGGDWLKEWYESAKAKVPGHKYMPHFKARKWDGYKNPGKYCRRVPGGGWEFRGSFGFLPDLLQEAGADPVDPLLTKAERVALVARLTDVDPTPRDYQRKGIVLGLERGWGRLGLATNAGKGMIISIIAEHLLHHRGVKTLILADEVAVFEALVDEIRKWTDEEPAEVKSGIQTPPEGDICVAMVKTLALRVDGKHPESPVWREWLDSFHSVLLDEADKASAKTWQQILKKMSQTFWRLGFSGTFPPPGKKHDDLVMTETMGPLLLEVKNEVLVEREISAKPEVFLAGFDAGESLRTIIKPADWREMSGAEKRLWIYDNAVVGNPVRHEFVHSLLRPDVPTCIIVNRIEHGEALQDMIPGSVFLSGQDSTDHRSEVLDRFADRDFDVLVVTKILDRGTNRLGHAVDLIFASGEGSHRQTLQRIGRGLRRTDGKEFLRLVDVIDRGHKYLNSASRKRIKVYAKEGFAVNGKP